MGRVYPEADGLNNLFLDKRFQRMPFLRLFFFDAVVQCSIDIVKRLSCHLKDNYDDGDITKFGFKIHFIITKSHYDAYFNVSQYWIYKMLYRRIIKTLYIFVIALVNLFAFTINFSYNVLMQSFSMSV